MRVPPHRLSGRPETRSGGLSFAGVAHGRPGGSNHTERGNMNEQYTRAPHQSPRRESSPSPNAALMIDFDNVTMAIRSNLGQELRNFLNSDIVRGKVSVQRAYADWRRYPQYIVPLSEASIDLIFAPAYGSSKKNATDIRLAIDALELVFTRPEIGTYILLSGDSDFSSLVLKLKEYGKYIIGVGLQESSSELLVQNCDEYYSYNSLSGLTAAEEMETRSHDPWQLVEKAVARMDDRDDVMRSDRLKQVMLEFDSGFDEKDHGFSKFNRFLAEASSRGLVKLRKIGDGHYEVAPTKSTPEEPGDGGRSEEARPDRQQKKARRGDGRRSREGGRESRGGGRESRGGGDGGREASTPPPHIEAASLRDAYDLLRDVVSDLSGRDSAVRDSEVKREMLRRNGNFDEAELGFSKFSRFLRQAYDEGVVQLTTDPDGNYHLQPEGAEPVTFGEAESQVEGADRKERARAASETGAGEERARQPEPETAGPAEAAPPTEESADEADETDAGRETAAPSGGRRRRGLGRRRRGSRSSGPGRSDKPGSGGTGIGPVDTGEHGEAGTEAGQAEDASARPAAGESGGGRSRPRGGLGRFRRGRSAADTDEEGGPEEEPSSVPGPVEEASTAAAGNGDGAPGGARESATATESGAVTASPSRGGAAPAAEHPPVPDEAEDDPVGYMVGNYPGVGRKTAEKLVDAFGDSVFEVIDGDPARLTSVLPEHRAQAVIQARQAERERAGT